jgi:hypothetical protein
MAPIGNGSQKRKRNEKRRKLHCITISDPLKRVASKKGEIKMYFDIQSAAETTLYVIEFILFFIITVFLPLTGLMIGIGQRDGKILLFSIAWILIEIFILGGIKY